MMLMSMIMLQMENHFSAKQQKHEKDYHNSKIQDTQTNQDNHQYHS